MKKRMGLGRGLDALLAPDEDFAATKRVNSPQTVRIDALTPGAFQPRQHIDSESLAALAASIRSQGMLQPILVRPLSPDRYEILAGERRWRAAQLAELTEVPILIREISDNQALLVGLIENIQRENLNPIEEATGISRLIDEFGMTHKDAAEALGRSRSSITNALRLLNLAESVQEMLAEKKIDMGHARALLGLPLADQVLFANKIIEEQLSVRQTEEWVRDHLAALEKLEKADGDILDNQKPLKEESPDARRLRERLSDWLGATVSIDTRANGKGALHIKFSNLDQLSAIFTRLGFDVDAGD